SLMVPMTVTLLKMFSLIFGCKKCPSTVLLWGTGLTGCVIWLAVNPCVCWVGEFAVASNVGSAFLALECFVSGYVRICFSGAVVGDSVESAVGAGPFLAGPHAHVRPVLNVWAESVKYGFSRLNVSFVVTLDGLLRFGITVDGCLCDVGTVLVSFRDHAESL